MPGILSDLLSNPNGWGSSPPAPYYQGEIRSSLSPQADAIGQKYGPKAGSMAQMLMDGWDTAGSTAKDVAKGLSGIGAAQDAGDNLAHAVQDGDYIKGAGSIVQAGLAALPAAGKLAAPLYETAPRLASMLLAGAGAGAATSGVLSSDPAEAKTRRAMPQQAPSAQSVLPGLSDAQSARLQLLNEKVQNADWQSGTERKAIIAEKQQLEGISADAQRANNDATAKATEIEATAKAQRDADAAATAQKAADDKAALDQPFQARHPDLAMGLALGAPMASGALSAMGMTKIASKGKGLLADLLAAREGGDVTKMAESAAALDQWTKSAPAKQALAIGVPATLPADARVVGDVVDKYALPDTSEAQNKASKRLGDPVQYAKDAIPAVASGLVWGGVGSKLAPSAPRGDAKAMLSLYGNKSPPTLSDLLQSGAKASADVQGPIALFQKARQARESGNLQADSADALAAEAARAAPEAGAPNVPSLSSTLDHHSARQPRKNGRFNGPPLEQDND